MSIAYSKLKKYAFACLALPTAVFALGYLKWYIGICMALLVALAYFFAVRDVDRLGESEGEQSIFISKGALALLVGAVVAWCYFGGIGNLYYQSGDWWARNAIFRDLISHEWPVIYDVKDAGLVYYIGFWLPPAAVGKAALAITSNLDIAFFVGNMVLWAWSAMCVILALLSAAVFVRAGTKKKLAVLILFFIFFSGLDIVGTLFKFFVWKTPIGDHVEWWSQYQFSSVTTCLFWVVNQAVLSWLATSCFLNERNTRNYAFIVVMCASAAPLPCVGLGIYMVGSALSGLVKAWRLKEIPRFIKDVLTPQNIIAAFAVFPVYLLYYATNLAINTGGAVATVRPPLDLWTVLVFAALTCAFVVTAIVRRVKKRSYIEFVALSIFGAILFAMTIVNHNMRINYVFTVLFECVLYLAILWKDLKHRSLFYITLAVFLICPLVRVGTAADFCMRASIPAVFVLMALCARFLFDHWECLGKAPEGESSKERKHYKTLCILLAVVFLLGSYTPYKEFERGVRTVVEEKKIDVVNDEVYTLDQIFTGSETNLDRNFIAKNYSETLFFKYLAK